MVGYWTIPRMWEGRTVAVMASGPSMSQEVADKVRAAKSKVQTHGLSIEAPSITNGGTLLVAPEGFSNISGHNGRSYNVNADRTVIVHEKDVGALLSLGFTRQGAAA